MSARQVTVHFEGRALRCRADASVAVALWENGIRTLSHSIRFGRPRGISCAKGHCCSCLMRIDGVDGIRACITPVHDGQLIERQLPRTFRNRMGQKTLDHGGPLFDAGFPHHGPARSTLLARFFRSLLPPGTPPAAITAEQSQTEAVAGSLGLFPGNDLPGLFTPSALSCLLDRDELRVAGCRAVVVMTAGTDCLHSAAMLHARGAVTTVVTDAPDAPPPPGTNHDPKWQVLTESRLASVHGDGETNLTLTFTACNSSAVDRPTTIEVDADLAVMSRHGFEDRGPANQPGVKP